MKNILLLMLAGSLGALLRYGVSHWIDEKMGSGFPWGTLAVNVSGCFIFGFIWLLAEKNCLVSHEARLIILTGFVGAFTTFSTFAFESVQLFNSSQWMKAFSYLGASQLAGILAVMAGWKSAVMVAGIQATQEMTKVLNGTMGN